MSIAYWIVVLIPLFGNAGAVETNESTGVKLSKETSKPGICEPFPECDIEGFTQQAPEDR